MHSSTLPLQRKQLQIAVFASVVALAAWLSSPAHAKDAGEPSNAQTCAVAQGATSCARSVVGVGSGRAGERLSRGANTTPSNARQPAGKAPASSDPEREIWRHHGVG